MEQHIPLEPDRYYHIYNHAVGKENLFREDENYIYFLRLYTKYIYPVADTFAYCLMPNHFHLAVRIKGEGVLREVFKDKIEKRLDLQGRSPLRVPNPERAENPDLLQQLISKQFSNLFNSYAQAFNKQQNRMGNLFHQKFHRKPITSNAYFQSLIHYIHFNPVHHGFVEDLRDWRHSSFEAFFSEKATKISRDEALAWFGNWENFLAFHQREIDEQMVLELEGMF